MLHISQVILSPSHRTIQTVYRFLDALSLRSAYSFPFIDRPSGNHGHRLPFLCPWLLESRVCSPIGHIRFAGVQVAQRGMERIPVVAYSRSVAHLAPEIILVSFKAVFLHREEQNVVIHWFSLLKAKRVRLGCTKPTHVGPASLFSVAKMGQTWELSKCNFSTPKPHRKHQDMSRPRCIACVQFGKRSLAHIFKAVGLGLSGPCLSPVSCIRRRGVRALLTGEMRQPLSEGKEKALIGERLRREFCSPAHQSGLLRLP